MQWDRRTGLSLVLALTLATPAFAQQQTPPAPSAPREAKIPQPVERTLENGLRVIVIPKPDVPLVASRLLFKTGAEADPAGREGLAALTSSVLTTGTKTRTAEQIARGIEALGATLDASAGWDNSTIDVSVLSSNFTNAMTFVADVARNPTFAKDEFDRERAQAIDAVQVSLQEPRPLAGLVASRVLFGSSPYAHAVSGTPVSLDRIKREELSKFHSSYYRPDNAVWIVGGDVKADAVFELAQKLFGSWPRGTAPKAATEAAETQAAAGPRVVVIDMPEAGQAAVIVNRRGIRRSDPLLYQALVTNSVLGGGYSARLNQEIRIKRGLSYGAGSSFDPRREVGPFMATTQTKNESAAEVVGIIADEMKRLSQSDVPEAELTPRKAVLIGGFAQSLETSEGIVDRVSTLALHGMPLTDINKYISSVQAVSAEDVRKFASANFGSDANVVIVGNASQFVTPLRARFQNVEVIPRDELDLDSPTLRRQRKEKQ
ncbi:MAG TPA: pitrilysin family protein [Thermoanaerobaculia bacterium]|jgi:zinc protease